MFDRDFIRTFPRLGAARLEKRRRKKRLLYRYPGREPPHKRKGKKFSSVMVPMDVYLNEYKSIFDAHGLLNIFLVTPQTSEARIRQIQALGYDVSKIRRVPHAP